MVEDRGVRLINGCSGRNTTHKLRLGQQENDYRCNCFDVSHRGLHFIRTVPNSYCSPVIGRNVAVVGSIVDHGKHGAAKK